MVYNCGARHAGVREYKYAEGIEVLGSRYQDFRFRVSGF